MFLSSQKYKIALVAQWIEHLTSDQMVVSSNLAGGAYLWGYNTLAVFVL